MLVNMDADGTCHGVMCHLFNGGENMSFFCWDRGNCPLCMGVHTKRVSIEQGSSVLLCKKIIVCLKEKCILEK